MVSASQSYLKNQQVVTLNDVEQGSAGDIIVKNGDIHVCGIVNNGSHYVATYWKNGSQVSLSNGINGNEYARSMDLYNDAVFISGSIVTDDLSSKSIYWEDGVLKSFSQVNDNISVEKIIVRFGDIYMLGTTVFPDKTYPLVTYWKNGIPHYMTDGTRSITGSDFDVAGKDVLVVGGGVNPYGKTVAMIWVNGIEYDLTDGSIPAVAHPKLKR